jgi:protein TonB
VPFDEVDVPPRILKIVKPRYPPLALQARIGGVVVLRVLVSEKGQPARIEVLREARGGLTQAAVEAVRTWTFEPATRDGVAVRTWMTVPIPFEP